MSGTSSSHLPTPPEVSRMPDLNGEAATVLSSTPFPISSAKRKREGSSGVNGDGDAISSSAQIEDQESRHIQDVWALLKA